MIFNPAFQWKKWLISFLPGLLGLGFLGLMVSMRGASSYRGELDIRIEASVAELWEVVADPHLFLPDFPLGDGLWFPRKGKVQSVQQLSPHYFCISLQADRQVCLDYIRFPEQHEVWILTSEDGDANLWFRMVKIIPLDTSYCRFIISTFRPNLSVPQKIEKTFYVQSQMNVIDEDYLYHFKERVERKRRRISLF
ncbi:hypothetical protein ACFL27_08010 [candidate division CSSED10-310 bacterium]|uniref:SRPBCC family protein n=1 Tax=candidate division CSSED10-310 bacterium TaxID=2855610 RepID=A0ABV6YV93_UNCC1